MADDVFGNPSLFQEFEKPRDPSDTILLKKLDGEFQEECDTIPVNGIDANESDENERGVSIVIGSSDTEDSHGSCDDIQEAECESETVSKNGTGRIKRVPKKTQHNSNTSICSETSSSSRIHKEQIEALKRENARLKQHSRIIDPSKFVHSEGGPVVQLIFLNNAFARKYRGQIEQFIAQLVAQERRHGLSTRAGPSSVCEVDGDPEATAKQTKASTVIGCSQIYHSFVVDNMGWPLVNSDPSVTDSWNMPRYEQSFPRALADDDDDDDNGGKKEKRRKAACFNCGGEHILSECQMKKDFAQIQKNRRDFQTQHQGPRGPKGSRYHVDDPRFSKFTPGVISDELRRALNLKKNQLPQYIYQMRVLGYPPGYLADAQVCTSGITMFDRHGKAISVDGEAPEEGEIDADKDTQKVEYDVSKIVEYPGFNVDPPEGTIDESRKLRAPPMKDHHRKEALEAQLLNMSSGTKRSTNDEGGRKQKKLKTRRSEDLQSVDMEIADSSGTEDELSRDRDGRLARLRSARLSSTTLEELEAEHAMLRRQLAAAEGTNEDVEVLIIDSSSDESFVPPLPPTPKRPPLPLGTPPVTPQQNSHMPPPWKRTPLKLPKPKNTDGNISTPPTAASTPCKGAVAPNTPQMTPSAAVPCTPESSLSVSMATPSSGGSISVESGTPVHEADQHLPDPSKFASCISEHIPFENLPNATGTFERVRRVLKKGKK